MQDISKSIGLDSAKQKCHRKLKAGGGGGGPALRRQKKLTAIGLGVEMRGGRERSMKG